MKAWFACVLLAIALPALAHDHDRPDLKGWYQSLSSGKGPCCDGDDAVHLADVDWDHEKGHYRVRIDGEWINVEDTAVVNQPNRDGRALVWTYKSISGVYVRCFMPGVMT